MKKFIHAVGEYKFITSLYFMAAIILGTIGSYLFHGIKEFQFVTIWQILGMSMVFGGLHYIQFSKISPPIRIFLHGILSYITVVLFSVFCKWGFIETTQIFWQFTIIFLFVYIIVSIAFSIYYANEEAFLNKKLDEYKQKNK